jgi:hypothetical protein
VQLWYQQRKSFGSKAFRADLFYYCLLQFIALALDIAYWMQTRARMSPDAGLWCLTLLAITALNFWITIRRYRTESDAVADDDELAGGPKKVTAQLWGTSIVQPESSTASVFVGIASVVNATARVICLIVLALMLGGAWIQAIGWNTYGLALIYISDTKDLTPGRDRYSPRGSFFTTSTGQRVHYLCEGPVNNTLPTFWIVNV